MRRHLLIVIAAGVALAGRAGGVELSLSARALAEAIDIGQSRLEAVRSRFHLPYRIAVARPPVDYVDVVTPFRRVALAAETRARVGDRRFGQREALAVLAEGPQRIDLAVELTFHPQNTYIGIPPYEVRLLAASGTGAPAVEPSAVIPMPRFGARMQGMPLPYPYPLIAPAAPGAEPLTGGMLLVQVHGPAVGQDVYEVLVIEAGQELARARIDFGALR